MIFGWFKRENSEPTQEYEEQSESYEDIGDLAYYFEQRTGVTFKKQPSILKSKLISFCKQRSLRSFEALMQKIQHDATLEQELIDYLTTNETYFYREFSQIEKMVKSVASLSKSVRILSAPCATGEEPYSIAIALLEAGVSADRFEIVGIDINSDAINKAKQAIYKERNIRNLDKSLLARYFYKHEERYRLKEEIKLLVAFKVQNIFDSSFEALGEFDFLFSRNMLIYFDPQTKIRAKEILERRVRSDNGEIFFGHADLF